MTRPTASGPSRAGLGGVLAVLLAVLVVVLLPIGVRADEPSIDALRRELAAARSPTARDQVLDRLVERIGRADGFADAGVFADWLGTSLPESTSGEPTIAVRRAWAYLAARRGGEAVPILERVLARDPSAGAARAYLGEALRQTGRPREAIESLAAALRAGYTDPFVRESAVKAAFELRKAGGGSAPPLAGYAEAFAAYLDVRPDAEGEAALTRMLLEDRTRSPGTAGEARAVLAEAAGRHALRAVRADPSFAGAAPLVFEAAEAVGPGGPDRFDLLAWAVRLYDAPQRGGHDRPEALVLLAEAASAEGRYELAAALARRRLGISDSPAAWRVMDALPPDATPADGT